MRSGRITLAVGALVAVASAAAAASSQSLIGRWVTPTGGVVEFTPCATPRPGLCGRLAMLGGSSASERLDVQNPDAGLRGRNVLGLEIVSGLRQTAASAWMIDALYNPDDGRTYSGALQLRPDGALDLKGCALRVFCRTQQWRRSP